MKTRHRTASDQLEGRILEAALQLLSEHGVEALTVRGIATRANVAPMGIYNHFEGKLGVYEALWVEGFDRLTTAMDASGETNDPRVDLVNCGRNYRRFALAHPAHYRLMFMEDVRGFEPTPEAALASGRAVQSLVARVERAQRANLLPLDRPTDLAQSIWATVHGYVSLELLRVNFGFDSDATYDALLEAVIVGFGSRVTP